MKKRKYKKKGMTGIDWLATILVIIGGLNWGLIGFFKFNLVEFLLGSLPMIARVVYSLVGLSAVYSLFRFSKK